MQKDTVALNSDTLKEGDVVTLKSGGPNMTVQTIGCKVDSVSCIWFFNQIRYSECFPLQTLRRQ